MNEPSRAAHNNSRCTCTEQPTSRYTFSNEAIQSIEKTAQIRSWVVFFVRLFFTMGRRFMTRGWAMFRVSYFVGGLLLKDFGKSEILINFEKEPKS